MVAGVFPSGASAKRTSPNHGQIFKTALISARCLVYFLKIAFMEIGREKHLPLIAEIGDCLRLHITISVKTPVALPSFIYFVIPSVLAGCQMAAARALGNAKVMKLVDPCWCPSTIGNVFDFCSEASALVIVADKGRIRHFKLTH